MKFLMIFLVVLAIKCYSQITVEQSHYNSIMTAGNGNTTYNKSGLININIGSKGATTWDFSALVSDGSFSASYVDPAVTAYISLFSGADFCQTHSLTDSGMVSEFYTYYENANGVGLMGIVVSSDVDGEIVTVENTALPVIQDMKAPLVYGDNWTQTVSLTSTMKMDSIQVMQTITNTQYTSDVDAYGTLTMPGGASVEALRIKRTSASIITGEYFTSYEKSIEYIYFSRKGYMISIQAADTLQPETGTIRADEVCWYIPNTTSAADIMETPSSYKLYQNYPNPFNPTTRISFELPVSDNVKITVTDVTGREVQTAADGFYGVGRHEVQFDGSKLNSGVYFYTLYTTGQILTGKMMLLK